MYVLTAVRQQYLSHLLQQKYFDLQEYLFIFNGGRRDGVGWGGGNMPRLFCQDNAVITFPLVPFPWEWGGRGDSDLKERGPVPKIGTQNPGDRSEV